MEHARMARSTTLTPQANDAARKAQQEEAQRQNIESARERDDARRVMFSAFGLWSICPAKICRRARACRGDAARCMNERWHPNVPAEFKALLAKAAANIRDGMSHADAVAAAEASMAAHMRAADSAEASLSLPGPHGEERPQGRVSNHGTAPSFETRSLRCAPQDEAGTSPLSRSRRSHRRGPRLRAL
jgi:hypothetical protein